MDVTDLKEELLLLRKENAELRRTDSAETEGQGEIMTEQRRITDELRSGVANYPFRDNRDFALFEDIADRIDAALAERYVELPKDVDGEPIHIGDVMEDGLDQSFTPKKVKMLMLEGDEWMLNFGGGWCVMKHHEWRHHTPDTWERIIRDAVMRGADIQWRAEGGGRMTDYFVPEGYDLVERCKALAGVIE